TFGRIPVPVRDELTAESHDDSRAVLRVEVTRRVYERSLKVIETWLRRSREGALYYPLGSRMDLGMNTSVVLKEVAEGLNECGEQIGLYKLDWQSNDEVAVNYRPWQVPFEYVRRLRRLNEAHHVAEAATR